MVKEEETREEVKEGRSEELKEGQRGRGGRGDGRSGGGRGEMKMLDKVTRRRRRYHREGECREQSPSTQSQSINILISIPY